MNVRAYILVLGLFGILFSTSCSNKLSNEKLEGKWVTDSIIVYRGGEKQILQPEKNADNIANQLICNPRIYEFNNQNQLLNYQLSDNENSKTLSEFSFNQEYFFVTNSSKDTIPYTYISKNNREIIKLDFKDNNVKTSHYISKRDMLDLKTNSKLSLEVFKDKLEDARRDFDEFNNYCRAFTKMTFLNKTLDTINEENLYYSNGLLPSLYILSLEGKQKQMASEIAKKILEEPNRKFYSIEFSTNDYSGIGMKARTYGIGYTHPMVEFELLKDELKKNISSLDKAYLNRDFALKWFDFEWSRMESSSGMSYADTSVERIYFDKELDSEIKLKLLLELGEKLKGSSQGNAYYCLFLMFENDRYKKEDAKIYLAKSKNIFENIKENGHVRDMLGLINEKLN